MSWSSLSIIRTESCNGPSPWSVRAYSGPRFGLAMRLGFLLCHAPSLTENDLCIALYSQYRPSSFHPSSRVSISRDLLVLEKVARLPQGHASISCSHLCEAYYYRPKTLQVEGSKKFSCQQGTQGFKGNGKP